MKNYKDKEKWAERKRRNDKRFRTEKDERREAFRLMNLAKYGWDDED